MYYDYSKIDSYDCPLKIVVSRRGLGKTFGKLKFCTEKFLTKGYKFIYVVETGEMVQTLTKNNGERFWCSLLNYYETRDTSRKRYFYSKITQLVVDEDENGTKISKSSNRGVTKIVGGTIKINNQTAGYIIDMNSFGEIKRNNFDGVKYIIVDEFISEKLDKTSLENPKKVSSLIQSIARLRDVKIYLLGNTVRQDDPILVRMNFKLDKYGWYKYSINNDLFAVLHFVNPQEYPDFDTAHKDSVSGKFSKMLGETHEEENKFISDLPQSRRLNVFKFRKGGSIYNIIRDNTIISIREMDNGNYAVLPFIKTKSSYLYCLTEKEQGYKLGYHIICDKNMRQWLMNMQRADILYYYTEIEYNKLKLIIKGD